jgi:hypothetical protein
MVWNTEVYVGYISKNETYWRKLPTEVTKQILIYKAH